jgi:hypothetical protein
MTDEVHLFMAVARAASTGRYPAGEHHPMLVFVRQRAGDDHDWAAAELVALRGGWTEIDFTKAGILPPEAADQPEEPFRSCYAEAVAQGSSIMVYETVVQPKPQGKTPASPEHPH